MGRIFNRERAGSELEQAVADCRSYFWVVFLFSIVTNLLMLAFPIYMLQVYDRVLTTSHADTLLMLTVIVGGALLIMACIDGLRTAMTLRIGGWLVDRLGPVYLASGVRARLMGRAASSSLLTDLTEVRNFISTQGLTFFCDSPWVPVFVVIIWLIHPYLGALAAVTAVLLLIISIVNEAATRPLLRHAGDVNTLAMREADATVRNAEVVSSMGMLPALVERWQFSNFVVLDNLRRAGERGGVLVSFTKFLRLFAQVGVLGLGALLVIWGELTAGAMIACSILLGRALAPVEMAMGAWKNFTQARLAYGRLKSHLATFPTPSKRTRLPAPTGHVSVKRLSFESNGQQILRDVSLEIEPGDAIAVIGPSAAGKSTLCRFLVGLAAPSEGEIRLDDSVIHHWDPKDLGPHIGYLPQYVELFTGTVKENISRMGADDDAAMIAAAKLAHAHDMIQRLPDGYDTVIGEGSVGLSAGQRQRIGLARAVFGDPKLIVLDEPNANLDQAGESALAAAIAELKSRGAAIVMVGHRPSTLSEATKILLLRDGRVQLFGPRDEVISTMREKTIAAREGKTARPSSDPPTVMG
jgi:ATP-binding cassette subfamily C protein/ATP-binding cassette subfamily C exporter for protease/lipase/ATP-binding cassette subfamily C protein EexD